MKLLPLLSEQPRSVQILLAVVIPALYGAVTGYFLGVSEPVYLVLAILGVLGAVGAGFDHFGARAGAWRGVIAGSVFGASILIAHEIHGADAKAHIPEPPILLVVVTTVIAIAFATLGGWLRERMMRRQGATPESEAAAPAEVTGAVEAPPVPEALAEEREAEGEHSAAAHTGQAVPGEKDGVVSLNTGSFEQYRALGMSVTQAKRVIAHREALDGYSSLDQLDQVPGFSKAFLVDMKAKLTL
ncbi:MAG: ComEA family DNA-binding protein [Solirubrobacterales bacterium]